MEEYGLWIAVAAGLAAFIVTICLIIGMRRKRRRVTEPIPGGGGSYTMYLEGMNCEHCKANVESALAAFPGIQARADWKTGTVRITYSGYPQLELLDQLRAAVESAGFTVKEIK